MTITALNEKSRRAVQKLIESSYAGRDELCAAAELLESGWRSHVCRRLGQLVAGHAAQLQQITYQEFLPVLLGPDALDAYAGYDETINPGLSSIFSTAAFRFGHSTINPEIPRLDAMGAEIAAGHLSLRDATFNSQPILNEGIEPILRGLSTQLAQNVDTLVINELRNMLFGPPGSGGLDLTAINIQR